MRLSLIASSFAARHRRALALAAWTLGAGFAVTALAVAPLAPDAELLPLRVVREPLVSADLPAQLQALAEIELALVRSERTRPSDSTESLLARLGVRDADAAALLRQDASWQRALASRGPKPVRAHTDAQGRLLALNLWLPGTTAGSSTMATPVLRLQWQRVQGLWAATAQSVVPDVQLRVAQGRIRSSLFAASDEAGLPDTVAMQLAEIFSGDIDFHRDFRRGDRFQLVYEVLSVDGEVLPWNEGSGRVLAAQFVRSAARAGAERVLQAFWHADAQGHGAYYDAGGRSRERAYLASPLAFSRMTSGFATRVHPLEQRMKAHLGVDYAAPTGTPVRAVGEGTVEFAGWMGGYGNVVQLRHGARHLTLYAHLSRIDVRRGERVEQGRTLGAVGATGWATGPHLHYEFRVDGQHQDPAQVVRASDAAPLPPGERDTFDARLALTRHQLDLAGTLSAGVNGVE